MRKALVALVLLLLVAAAADVFARRAAEERVAGRLQRTFDLASEPEVSVREMPFLVALLRGEISSIVMKGHRVGSEDVILDDVKVEMDDVRFSLSDVVDGSGRVTSRGGSGSASITQVSLNKALGNAGAPFTLSLEAGGATANSEAGAAQGDVALEGDALSLKARGAPAVVLDLPSLGGRVAYESLSLEAGRVTLAFTVDGLQLSS